MPGQFLTKLERARLTEYPTDISEEDVISYFSLTDNDRVVVLKRRGGSNKIGFLLLIGTLRYMGYYPENLSKVPEFLVTFIGDQLNIKESQSLFSDYLKLDNTITDHSKEVAQYLRFRRISEQDLDKIKQWLLARALEHDKPLLLFNLICEDLKRRKLIRPGISVIERLVTTTRQDAHQKIYSILKPVIKRASTSFLDKLIETDDKSNRTTFHWLQTPATSNTPEDLLKTLDKLNFLREHGIHKWDLSIINPNRQKVLAQIGKHASNQLISRMNINRRYPILVAFLYQALEYITDEVIDIFDACLDGSYLRAKRDWEAYKLSMSRTTNLKLLELKYISEVILNNAISDNAVRTAVFQKYPRTSLEKSRDECIEMIRPKHDKFYDFWATRYSYIRQFSPELLDKVEFCSNDSNMILEAIKTIRNSNHESTRKLEDESPTSFVPKDWNRYIFDSNNKIVKKFYELCTLMELRKSLRSGNIWVKNSIKYADPQSYLMPISKWLEIKPSIDEILSVPITAEQWISQKKTELKSARETAKKALKTSNDFRIENGDLIVSKITADDEDPECEKLKKMITGKLPAIELPELVMEVDQWTQFSDCFEHAGGSQTRSKDMLIHLYAAIIAQACNFELKRMADITGLTYSKLAWCSNWYLREETIQAAINRLVDYQYHLPLSKHFGDGTLSSSDGQRFQARRNVKNASSNPKYFSYGKGMTFYSWTSNQLSQYGTKAITTKIRDSTFVLDAIQSNETELDIQEHTTDTSGYTEIIFSLFSLLGLRFSPHIRDISDQTLYKFDRGESLGSLDQIISGVISQDVITENWDDMLRAGASIKLGWVTSSLLVSKLKSYPQQNILAKALQEMGRVEKTLFILRYISSKSYRKRIRKQLNKGEAIHDLRKFLRFVDNGVIKKVLPEEQNNQASCLTLLTNLVIVWNTRYMGNVVQTIKDEQLIKDIENHLPNISPCRFEHINRYGRYTFDLEKELSRSGFRPLRSK